MKRNRREHVALAICVSLHVMQEVYIDYGSASQFPPMVTG
jgi:hypothetical protein